MQHEQLQSLARALHGRIIGSRGTVGLYYDSMGAFRISPLNGIRYRQVQAAFPDSIVGVYNNKIDFDDFFEDFEFFCQQMGAIYS